jgi:outer membrane lipoprotein SlyB
VINFINLKTEEKMKSGKILSIALVALFLSGCAVNSESGYSAADVGHPTQVVFGTIVQSREISIQELNTGAGAAIGVGGGALAGAAIGHSGVGMLAGMLIGGIAGAVAENAADGHGGYEYTVTLETGNTVTIAQNKGDDPMLAPGQRCMVQMGGRYSRVLPAAALPTKIGRPKHIEVTDE